MDNPTSSSPDIVRAIDSLVRALRSQSISLDSNPYKFHVYRNAGLALVASSVTKIPFDLAEFDSSSNFDITTNRRFTAPVNGYYSFGGSFGTGGVTPTRMFISLYKNGVEYKRGNDTGTTVQQVTLHVPIMYLTAGDYVELMYWSSTAGGNMGLSYLTYFSGYLVTKS